ncbi:hypothetical protein AAG570_013885 [Ranatra chinensis]|uniref:Thrombospondin-like N-terminal domain-containing protein n=1 Tax=Ranatra chinensis TaxID=642074 RepID=A0ABD0YW02_9HEMI
MPEIDLLPAIKIPFEDPSTQYFENGSDGFPALGLRPGSDIKTPYRLFLPERFHPQFSIAITVKLASPDGGGFLFAVVNPLETVVQLGVSLASSNGNSNVSLLYTDLSSGLYTSQTLATFLVPIPFTKWTTLGLKVTRDTVSVYLNCEQYDARKVKREPIELVFDSASTLYIGQAGPIIKGPFHVSSSQFANSLKSICMPLEEGVGGQNLCQSHLPNNDPTCKQLPECNILDSLFLKNLSYLIIRNLHAITTQISGTVYIEYNVAVSNNTRNALVCHNV